MSAPMQSPLEMLLEAAGRESRFPPNSRYHGLGTRTWTGPDGRARVYVERRFLPQPLELDLLVEHAVGGDERLDHIAYRYLGDPELFWRVCDANATLRPDDLEQPGRRLRVALPPGMPGGARG
jgi:hypothetical protein